MTELVHQFRVKVSQKWGTLCPNCEAKLDHNHHGYEMKYGHCHNCGFCTQDERFKVGK